LVALFALVSSLVVRPTPANAREEAGRELGFARLGFGVGFVADALDPVLVGVFVVVVGDFAGGFFWVAFAAGFVLAIPAEAGLALEGSAGFLGRALVLASVLASPPIFSPSLLPSFLPLLLAAAAAAATDTAGPAPPRKPADQGRVERRVSGSDGDLGLGFSGEVGLGFAGERGFSLRFEVEVSFEVDVGGSLDGAGFCEDVVGVSDEVAVTGFEAETGLEFSEGVGLELVTVLGFEFSFPVFLGGGPAFLFTSRDLNAGCAVWGRFVLAALLVFGVTALFLDSWVPALLLLLLELLLLAASAFKSLPTLPFLPATAEVAAISVVLFPSGDSEAPPPPVTTPPKRGTGGLELLPPTPALAGRFGFASAFEESVFTFGFTVNPPSPVSMRERTAPGFFDNDSSRPFDSLKNVVLTGPFFVEALLPLLLFVLLLVLDLVASRRLLLSSLLEFAPVFAPRFHLASIAAFDLGSIGDQIRLELESLGADSESLFPSGSTVSFVVWLPLPIPLLLLLLVLPMLLVFSIGDQVAWRGFKFVVLGARL
jgi:hypothetical protein